MYTLEDITAMSLDLGSIDAIVSYNSHRVCAIILKS